MVDHPQNSTILTEKPIPLQDLQNQLSQKFKSFEQKINQYEVEKQYEEMIESINKAQNYFKQQIQIIHTLKPQSQQIYLQIFSKIQLKKIYYLSQTSSSNLEVRKQLINDNFNQIIEIFQQFKYKSQKILEIKFKKAILLESLQNWIEVIDFSRQILQNGQNLVQAQIQQENMPIAKEQIKQDQSNTVNKKQQKNIILTKPFYYYLKSIVQIKLNNGQAAQAYLIKAMELLSDQKESQSFEQQINRIFIQNLINDLSQAIKQYYPLSSQFIRENSENQENDEQIQQKYSNNTSNNDFGHFSNRGGCVAKQIVAEQQMSRTQYIKKLQIKLLKAEKRRLLSNSIEPQSQLGQNKLNKISVKLQKQEQKNKIFEINSNPNGKIIQSNISPSELYKKKIRQLKNKNQQISTYICEYASSMYWHFFAYLLTFIVQRTEKFETTDKAVWKTTTSSAFSKILKVLKKFVGIHAIADIVLHTVQTIIQIYCQGQEKIVFQKVSMLVNEAYLGFEDISVSLHEAILVLINSGYIELRIKNLLQSKHLPKKAQNVLDYISKKKQQLQNVQKSFFSRTTGVPIEIQPFNIQGLVIDDIGKVFASIILMPIDKLKNLDKENRSSSEYFLKLIFLKALIQKKEDL